MNRIKKFRSVFLSVVSLCLMAESGYSIYYKDYTEFLDLKENVPYEIAPLKAPFEMPQLKRPVFPDKTFNIRDYGAKPDGETKNTLFFKEAIKACHDSGGGKVLVPKGAWLTGPIHLKSNVNLHLEEGAEILFSTDPNDYLPQVFVRWAGTECYNYSPLVYANGCNNIAITGKGMLNGQGQAWWHLYETELKPLQDKLRSIMKNNIPVEERVFTNRPQLLVHINCKNVLLEGIIIKDSPFWHVQMIYCENVIVRKIIITGQGPNNDGVNMDSTRNALIEHCFFSVCDDNTAIKSGVNEDGWRVNRPSENVIIRNCTSRGGDWSSMTAIGSEMSGGVRNVFIHDMDVDGTALGLFLKSALGRGGFVENIHLKDINLRNLRFEPIRITTAYAAWFAGKDGKAPKFKNIYIQNLTSENSKTALKIIGQPQSLIENVNLDNISIISEEGMYITHVKDISCKNINCTIRSMGNNTVADENKAIPRIVRIGHYQCECKQFDFDANLKTLLKGLNQAVEARLDIVSFPESFLTGYYSDKEDAFKNSFTIDSPQMKKVLKETARFDVMFMVGLNERKGLELHNTIVLIERGKIIGTYSKAFPCVSYFTPGRSFPVFEKKGLKFGIIICADGGFIEPARILALKGAQFIFAPHYNLIPNPVEHYEVVRNDHIARAAENGVYFLRGNTVTKEHHVEGVGYDGYGYGDSYILNPNGEIVASAGLYDEYLMVYSLDLDRKYYGMTTRSQASGDALLDILSNTLKADDCLDP